MSIGETRPGIIFPTREIGTDKGAIRAFAQGVENMGFDFLLFYDHVALGERPEGNNQYTVQHAFHEPFTAMAYISAVTEEITLMPGVLVLPQRQTALVAKQAAEIALLSDNRLVLGVGTGTNERQFKAMGRGDIFPVRGKVLEEQVDLLRRYWTEEVVVFDGTYEKADHVGINPRPEEPIPIWFGGGLGEIHGARSNQVDRVLQRIAKLGDGWMPMSHPTHVEPYLERFREILTEHGRDADSFPVMGAFGRRLSTMAETERDQKASIRRWQELGVQYIAWGTMGQGNRTVEDHLSSAATFKTLLESN